jgi:tagaturonate epimerase
MNNWKKVCNMILEENKSIEYVRNQILEDFEGFKVYPHSIINKNNYYFLIAKVGEEKKLIIFGEGELYKDFIGYESSLAKGKAKICDLSNENCDLIRRLFLFTNPSNHSGKDITIGLGDRLGLASAGHIRLFKGKNAFPVLAQQSIRELNLTGRTYKDVLSAASWAVFQEGYTDGFGADGDHLKTPEEVKMALDCGFTMITLDCSEHINNNILSLAMPEIEKLYADLASEDLRKLESKYIGKEFKLENNHIIKFSAEEFKKAVLIYLKAINYTIKIYNEVIKDCGRNIDFEMSIDETLTSTTPESHYFVAMELIDAGVKVTSLAPRFCGEFQKGIDYIGDKNIFTNEFEVHTEIAKKLGYKISVHSGSDKFSVFPIVGEKTKGKYHLKTAGTNWLEAVRVIAVKNPNLYRKIHAFAIANLNEAKKYYHIGAKLENIPNIEKLRDNELPGLMDLNDSRQVLHITYGLILLAKNSYGTSVFRDEIYLLLNKYESEYYNTLEKHIGKHLSTLGI